MPENQLHSRVIQVLFEPLGFEKVTVSTAAVALPSLPDLARLKRVVIRALDQPISFRDDGTDPTATTGMEILADEILVYDGSRADQFKMIRTNDATGDADVRIAYYGL